MSETRTRPTRAGAPPGVVPRTLQIAVIRGGTSRGLLVREEDLPDDPGERTRALLRLFGGDAGILADGLGGESPILRKLALVSRLPDREGAPRVGYRFGQVSADLASVSHAAECGNVAAAVPLYAALQGWAPAPEPGGTVWMELLNTGRSVRAEWLEARADGTAGRLRLAFMDPAAPEPAPLGVHGSLPPASGAPTVACSVVRAMNDYVFIESAELGIDDPIAPGAVTGEHHDLLARLEGAARGALEGDPAVKICLVAPDPSGEGVMRALIVYPSERRTHGAFAVTGGITVGVASCLAGTVVQRCAGASRDRGRLTIRHPSGSLEVDWRPGPEGLPTEVGLERSARLILTATAH